MTAPSLEPDYADPPLLANARTALDVARLIALHDLTSFYYLTSTEHGTEAQTADEAEANALARALCRPGQAPRSTEWFDANANRHLHLSVGRVVVVCYQPAKEQAA